METYRLLSSALPDVFPDGLVLLARGRHTFTPISPASALRCGTACYGRLFSELQERGVYMSAYQSAFEFSVVS